jgi:hypothetical protein
LVLCLERVAERHRIDLIVAAAFAIMAGAAGKPENFASAQGNIIGMMNI